MAGRKRHSAEDIVRKLRRADELAAEGKTGEEVAAELGVAAATLYNWRRAYGGMDADAAKELKELREQNARLKRLLPRPNWRRTRCARWPSLCQQRPSLTASCHRQPSPPRVPNPHQNLLRQHDVRIPTA